MFKIFKAIKKALDPNEPSLDGRKKRNQQPSLGELYEFKCKGCGNRLQDHKFKDIPMGSSTALWDAMKKIYDLETCAPLPEGFSLHSRANGWGKFYTYWACSDNEDQNSFFKFGLKKHVCEGCGNTYKAPIQWIADFRADCQNPKCGWMIFRDGTQCNDND